MAVVVAPPMAAAAAPTMVETEVQADGIKDHKVEVVAIGRPSHSASRPIPLRIDLERKETKHGRHCRKDLNIR